MTEEQFVTEIYLLPEEVILRAYYENGSEDQARPSIDDLFEDSLLGKATKKATRTTEALPRSSNGELSPSILANVYKNRLNEKFGWEFIIRGAPMWIRYSHYTGNTSIFDKYPGLPKLVTKENTNPFSKKYIQEREFENGIALRIHAPKSRADSTEIYKMILEGSYLWKETNLKE